MSSAFAQPLPKTACCVGPLPLGVVARGRPTGPAVADGGLHPPAPWPSMPSRPKRVAIPRRRRRPSGGRHASTSPTPARGLALARAYGLALQVPAPAGCALSQMRRSMAIDAADRRHDHARRGVDERPGGARWLDRGCAPACGRRCARRARGAPGAPERGLAQEARVVDGEALRVAAGIRGERGRPRARARRAASARRPTRCTERGGGHAAVARHELAADREDVAVAGDAGRELAAHDRDAARGPARSGRPRRPWRAAWP